jgi:hypothetical protein
MDRPPDLIAPSDPPPPSGGLGPVGDWIGGEWPTQAAERIESVVGSVRRKTTGPAMVASRALVYGLVALMFATIAGILLLIAVLRALDALLPTWAVQMILGGLLCLVGFLLWSKRSPKETVA